MRESIQQTVNHKLPNHNNGTVFILSYLIYFVIFGILVLPKNTSSTTQGPTRDSPESLMVTYYVCLKCQVMSQIELSNCDSHCPSRLESWCVGWCDLRLFNSPHHHHYGDGPLLQTPPRKKHWLPNISIIDTYLVCVCVCVLCVVCCVLCVFQRQGAGLPSVFCL